MDEENKLDLDLGENAAEVAAYAKDQILSGNVSKDIVNALETATKLAKEMAYEKDDISVSKREAEVEKIKAETKKIEAETDILNNELANQKKKDIRDTIIESGKAAAPYVTCAVTTVSTFAIINKNQNFAEKIIKLVPLMENNLGVIPPITTKKIVDSIFSAALKSFKV